MHRPSQATSSDVHSPALSGKSKPVFHQYSNAPIIKRVPKSSRHLAATKLSRILDDIVERNTVDAWSRLFKFPLWCLAWPSRAGQRHSLATAVNRQLQVEADKPVPQLVDREVVGLLMILSITLGSMSRRNWRREISEEQFVLHAQKTQSLT